MMIPKKLIDKATKRLREEQGVVTKPWGQKLTVALAYPNRYGLGMSNLGFQTVYHLLNEFPHVLCERTFLPEDEDLRELERSGAPLFSLESQKPLRDFHCVAFSIPFENDYPHIITLLKLARLPVLSHTRSDYDPLVAGGGITTFLNPEPLAPFFDFFFIGEAEPVLPEVIEVLTSFPPKRRQKTEILGHLSRIEGIYVPQLHAVVYHPNGLIRERKSKVGVSHQIKRRWCESLDLYPTHTRVRTGGSGFEALFTVEVNRGCARGCRFCAASSAYRPSRVRSAEVIQDSISKAAPRGNRIGLLGTAVSDHPHLSSLGDFLLKEDRSFSVSSVRMDRVNGALAHQLKQAGCKSLALAPEAGSERLRQVLGKGISEDEIFGSVEALAGASFATVKLYFMIGLPTEHQQDIEAIVHLVRRLEHHVTKISSGEKRLRRITLSISAFVPKPFTPFQWHPMERTERLKEKLRFIRHAFKRDRHVVVTSELPKWAYIQCLLGRGDRRVAKILLEAESKGSFLKAFEEVDLNPDFFVYRERAQDEVLPWDFIDQGIDRKWLWSEYQEALARS
jgi:radical SAM superfamily enzyme YgiQ (UPF0313 family)